MYFPPLHLPFASPLGPTLVLHTAGPVAASAIRDIVRRFDAGVPVSNVRSLASVVDGSEATRRFLLRLLAAFALLAIGLAAVGVHGVIAYTVTLRTREMGLRVALGARRVEVLRTVIAHTLSVAIVGAALGLVGATVLSRLLARALFEVGPTDGVTYFVVGVISLFVALAASFVPAARATRVSPMAALRVD
jgi:putative ABC transport system permease protein